MNVNVMQHLNLLVLRCRDLESARMFYECIGMKFTRHSHGSGPEHYAYEDSSGVFELYPAGSGLNGDATGLGFRTKDIHKLSRNFETAGSAPQPIQNQPWGQTFIIRDPDGRRIEIKLEP